MEQWSGVTETLTGDSIPALSALYGLPVFIGVSSLAQGEVKAFDKYSYIRGSIGIGPLTRAIEDFFAAGGQKSKCLARVLAPDVAGSNGGITHTGTGLATQTAGGVPNDAYSVLVEVLTGGAVGAAVVRYSLDGGTTWDPKVTVPADGVVALGSSGATITFDTTTGELVAEDSYTWLTTAPSASNTVITTAIDEVLAAWRGSFEFMVIVGESASAFWTTLNTKLAAEWNNHNPIFAVCEAGPLTAATLAADEAALIADANGFESRYLMVTAGHTWNTDRAGMYQERGIHGAVAGILSKGKVSDSIGVLRDDFGKIVPAAELRPDGITESDLVLLNDARYTVPKKYEGYPGIYPNNGNLMSAPGDAFDSIEKLRVAAKMLRLMRVAALRNLHLDSDTSAAGSFGGESGLEYLRAELVRAVAPMKLAGELYKCNPNILSTPDDVFLDNTVRVRIDFSTNPKMKVIELEFDLISPAEFERRNA